MATLDAGDLRPYLKYSAATHLCLLGGALVVFGLKPSAQQEVYRIDFIGPTAGIANREPEAAPGKPAQARPPAGKVPPQQKAPEFSRPRRHEPLPRPSFLSPGTPEPKQPAAPAPAAAQPAAAPAETAAAPGSGGATGGEGSGASVSADLPNFPYPWYITQVRTALWSRWSARMPRSPGGVTVMFTILRNGAHTDLRVESSSGDDGYDYAALTAVQEAAPFAPLPPGFRDSFLKIHVRFTSQ